VLYENRNRVPRSDDSKYHLSTDLADHAIGWMQRSKAIDPARPFFLYVAPGATHTPHMAPKEWLDKFKGQFDMGMGPLSRDHLRTAEETRRGPAQRQAHRAPGKPAGMGLAEARSEAALLAMMEVFAAFGAHVDHEMGRVLDAGGGAARCRQHARHLYPRRQRRIGGGRASTAR
jgi:arylsulfatase